MKIIANRSKKHIFTPRDFCVLTKILCDPDSITKSFQTMKSIFAKSFAAAVFAIASSHGAQTFISTGNLYSVPSGITASDYQNGGAYTPFVGAPDLRLTTTLAIDPDNITARFSGSTTVSSTTFSYTTGTFNQQIWTMVNFPKPPTQIYADGFAMLNITLIINAGSFDSGTRNLVWNGSAYSIGPLFLGGIQGNAEITLSVTLGGQTTTVTQNRAFTTSFLSSWKLDLSNYPNTASVDLRLADGSFDGDISASAPNGFDASFGVVPEPSSSIPAAVGMLSLLIFRKRQR